MFNLDTKKTFLLALLSRAALLGLSHWMDRHTHVHFTDIDYRVLSDAAKHVSQGNSPFERHTFRYTPLLAYLLLPNLYFGEYFGKLVFVACEFVVGALILRLTQKRSESYRQLGLLVWFFNPFTITLSVRGSSDVLVTALVFWLLLLIKQRRFDAAAVIYGLTVHFRIYPLIFCVALYNSVAWKCNAKFFNFHSIRFGLVAAGTLALLTGLFYLLYGHQFLHEGYLYHLTRKDHRHNFSLMFMLIYLTFQQIDPLTSGLLLLVSLALILAVSFRFSRHLSFSFFLVSLVFVTYNKVVTAQYFVWFLQFVPLLAEQLFGALSPPQLRANCLLYLVWLAVELLWNNFAYRFETLGHDVFLAFHATNCLFFMLGVLVAFTSVRNFQLWRRARRHASDSRQK